MKRILSVITCIAVCTAAACATRNTSLGLSGGNQSIPMPAFMAKDSTRGGQLPKFAQIRVYHLKPGCELPNCPVMWDVVVPEEHSPTEFAYGGFPGFGSQTVISAQPLQPGERYLLVTLPSEFGERHGAGEFYFRVTPEGAVLAD